MNKRIKKKLQKRLGYMRYANYRISQTPIKFILRGEPVDQEIVVPCSVLLQTAGKPNKNKRVYSEPFLMKAMDDCIKRINSHDIRFVGESLHPPIPTFSIRSI